VLGEELVNEWVTVQSHDGFHVGSIYNQSRVRADNVLENGSLLYQWCCWALRMQCKSNPVYPVADRQCNAQCKVVANASG